MSQIFRMTSYRDRKVWAKGLLLNCTVKERWKVFRKVSETAPVISSIQASPVLVEERTIDFLLLRIRCSSIISVFWNQSPNASRSNYYFSALWAYEIASLRYTVKRAVLISGCVLKLYMFWRKVLAHKAQTAVSSFFSQFVSSIQLRWVFTCLTKGQSPKKRLKLRNIPLSELHCHTLSLLELHKLDE